MRGYKYSLNWRGNYRPKHKLIAPAKIEPALSLDVFTNLSKRSCRLKFRPCFRSILRPLQIDLWVCAQVYISSDTRLHVQFQSANKNWQPIGMKRTGSHHTLKCVAVFGIFIPI